MTYAAKSTLDPKGSIPGQLTELRETVALDTRLALVGEYSDEAVSAYHADRGPELAAAIGHLERLAAAHGTAELWVVHSDRLARGDGKTARHTVEIALWALKRNIRIRSLQDPETFRDLLYAVVTGQRNHEDSRRKGKASQAGIRRAAERGEHPGPPPDGYQVQKTLKDGRLLRRITIDPDRQPVIALIFRLALRGRTCGQIAATLSSKGLLAKPEQPFGACKPWDVSRLYKMIINPTYAGLAAHKGQVLAPGEWERYITPGQRDRLIARMHTPNPGSNKPTGESYLLAGLAWCGHCGSTLNVTTNRPRADGVRRRRYACSSHRHHRGQAQCPAGPIDAHTIEAMLIDQLPALLTNEQRPAPGAIKQRLRAAAKSADPRELDRAITAALTPPTTRDENEQTLARLHAWVETERRGRTPASRAQTIELNRMLRCWFASIAIRISPDTVVFTARSIHDTATSATVQQTQWARDHPTGRYGLIHHEWQRPQLIGTLQAWAHEHGRSPRRADWRRATHKHPSESAVLRTFGDWNQALHAAGLPRVPERREWSTQEIHEALRAWAREHGRAPYSLEWHRANATHPSSFTVRARHNQSWNTALSAAGLPIPPSKHPHRPWSHQQIEQAIRTWTHTHGQPPEHWEWLRAGPDHPNKRTVIAKFGSWEHALTRA